MKRPEDFVCPIPMVWNDVYGNLCRIAQERGLPKPPVPLILAAWWDTPALRKTLRWKETIEWADQHGVMDQIPELTEDQKHYLGD